MVKPWFLFSLLLVAPAFAQEPAELAAAVRYEGDFSARGELRWESEEEGETLSFTCFSQSNDKAFLLIITGPASRRGIGFLKRADELTVFHPRYNQFLRPAAGSVPLVSVFAGRPWELPAGVSLGEKEESRLAGLDAIKMLFTRHGQGTGGELWVDPEHLLPLKILFTGNTAGPVRECYFPRWKRLAGGALPLEWWVVEQSPFSWRVHVRLESLKAAVLPEFIFTRAYLQFLSGN